LKRADEGKTAFSNVAIMKSWASVILESLWTAVHVVAKRARERAKTTTIYIRRIENLQLWSDRVIHQSKGIALTKKIVYQDFRNIDLFGRKSGESVKVKI